MRLLLHEHSSPAIADELCNRGHDVLAVRATPELRQLADFDLLQWATEQGRAIATENVAGFVALRGQALSRYERHAGLVMTSPQRFPRTRAGLGGLVTAPDELLRALPDDDAPRARPNIRAAASALRPALLPRLNQQR